MKKMRKYSESTGLKAVPTTPTTFVARSSPHFMAALSGKTGQDQRKTSVYKTTATSPNPPRKHSSLFATNLPMIHVTMEEVEDRSSGSSQRKISSSNGPSWARGGFNDIDKNEGYSSSSNTTDRQRKISSKKGPSVLGETPLGRDLIFRRKISNTTAPPKKVDKAEEKEKLLMKYSLLDNATLKNDGKKRMKSKYLSRYNIETSSLPKRDMDNNWTARGRTQSLNFVPKSEISSFKTKATNKIFLSRTFPGETKTDNVFPRDRAQSLNLVLRGSGSVKTRDLNERQRGLFEIMEDKTKTKSPCNYSFSKEQPSG